MDVSDLLDIKAICDAGSYRKAAEMLGITQPTLSNRIAYLEGKLGAQLFDCPPQGVLQRIRPGKRRLQIIQKRHNSKIE